VISSVTVAFSVVAQPPVAVAALETALEDVPLPTGVDGDLTQLTGATLDSDSTGTTGSTATRTIEFTYPATTLTAAIAQSGPVATSIALAIAAGAQTVTPGVMTNIVVGSVLTIQDSSTPAATETVTVTAITAATFTATFANAHLPGVNVQGNGSVVATPASMLNVYGPVNTTSETAVAAPGSTVITPASLANIEVFVPLLVDEGTPNQETVVVTGVGATTFTATFANTHAAGFSIRRPASTLQIDFAPYATTASGAIASGTTRATATAIGPIAAGMELLIDAGAAAQEYVTVQSVQGATFVAKFANAHLTGATIATVASAPGTAPENVVVESITATTFTAVFQNAHANGANVGGIVNAMFPGGAASTVGNAWTSAYASILANALSSTNVASEAPVVVIV
jgi:hypothetical protein